MTEVLGTCNAVGCTVDGTNPIELQKAKDYEKRNVLRANEEVARGEGISILNSDAAFATFGTVSATKMGATGFMQLGAIPGHQPEPDGRQQLVQRLLQSAATGSHRSVLLAKVAAHARAGNPFETVLKEIARMTALIDTEGRADNEQLQWCNEERATNDANHAEKVSQIENSIRKSLNSRTR